MDFSQYKLGKLPFAPKAKDLKLRNYVADLSALIAAARVPMASDMAKMATPTGTMPIWDAEPLYNNIAGCCVFTAFAKLVNLINQLTGSPVRVTADDVKAAYMKYGGYDPNRPETDNGFVIRDLLGIAQREGLFGVKVLAYALVGGDPVEMAIASWLGCGVIGGYSLPISAQGQVSATGRQLWYVPPGGFPSGQGPGSWGGHCIHSQKQSPTLLGGNSWGEDTTWTLEWDGQCCDERWIVLVDAWFDPVLRRAPNGFALEDLLADVRARTA